MLKSLGWFFNKIELCQSLIDALDPILMKSCPTQLECAELDIKKDGYQGLIDVYKLNMKLCTIIALGQGTEWD